MTLKTAPNLVPTPATRALARRMRARAEQTSGAEAAMLLAELDPHQIYALVGLLLGDRTTPLTKNGRPRLADRFTDAQRRHGYARYRQGARDATTVAQYREYQRVQMRKYRAAA
jgi:hypothetical protein